MYLGDNGAKELVTICDHVHFSHRMNGLQTASSPLKGRGCGETHDTDMGNECSVGGLTSY